MGPIFFGGLARFTASGVLAMVLIGCGSSGPDCGKGPIDSRAVFSPDGSKIAYVDTDFELGPGNIAFLKVIDARSGQTLYSHGDAAFSFPAAAFSSDGQTLVRAVQATLAADL